MTGSDPRPMLYRSFDQAAEVVSRVSPEQFGLATPCTDFDVTALLAHLVGVGNRIASIGRGEPQIGKLPVPDGVPDDGWGAAFETAQDAALAVWANDELLERKIELPFGTFTGATVAAIYTLELTTHAWDLASATNQVDALDDDLAEASLSVAQGVLPPEERGGYIPFAGAVSVPEEASAYDRLAGFLGRQVS